MNEANKKEEKIARLLLLPPLKDTILPLTQWWFSSLNPNLALNGLFSLFTVVT
jgi:hypothetical protein